MFRGTPISQEPLRNNRFILEFPTDLGLQSFEIQTMDMPKVNINPVELKYFGQSEYVAGNVTVEAQTMSIIQHIGPSTSQKVMEWFRLHHEFLTNRSGYAVGYKKDLTIKKLDPTLVEVEKWILLKCQITSIDFGSLDHADDAISLTSMTVQPHGFELVY